jgi:hypothetical protein
MGVQIDDAGHQGQPAGVDDLTRVLAEVADRGNAALLDRDIRPDRIVAEPIDDGRTADHEVMHCNLLCVVGPAYPTLACRVLNLSRPGA